MKQQKYFNNKKPVKPIVNNRRAADNLISSAHKANMLITLNVLHKTFGFGAKRIERFMNAYQALLEQYNNGEVTIDELNFKIKKDLGIKVME